MNGPAKGVLAESGEDQKFVPTRTDEMKVLIQNAISSQAKVQIWTPQQKHRLSSKVVSAFESGSVQYLSLPRDPEEAAFEATLRNEGIVECLFSVTLPSDLIFFKGEYKRSHRGLMHFKINEPIYKVQRRRSIRMPMSNSRAHFALPGGKLVSARIMDVSDGGLGLLFEDEAVARFVTQGLILDPVRFKLGTHELCYRAEIVYRREVPSTGKLKKHFKAGVRFLNITEKEAAFITRFILEESSRFFGRL